MRRILQARVVLISLLVLSLTVVGAWAGDVAGEIANENAEAIGSGDGNIWVIPALSSPSVKNGGKLTIQTLVKAAAGVQEVRAEILDGDRVVDSLMLAAEDTRVSGAGLFPDMAEVVGGVVMGPSQSDAPQVGIWQAEWSAHGLEEKFYSIRLTVTDAKGNTLTDESLRFADPIAGNADVGSPSYPNGGLRRQGVHIFAQEWDLETAVIDVANGYAYFGTYTVPGTIVKVALGVGGAAPTRVASLMLNEGEDYLSSSVIDTANGYAYFGTGMASPVGVTGQVVKIALGAGDDPPTRVGALTLNVGENNLRAGVIDAANGYAYFGAYTNPGQVIKVALGSGDALPTRIGAVTLNEGEGRIASGVIDAANGYAYFAAGTLLPAAVIVKIALGAGDDPPTRVAGVTLEESERDLRAAVIDPTNGYAYFGGYQVVKVALGVGNAAPVRIGAIPLEADVTECGGIDVSNGYAYFGSPYPYGTQLIKVELGEGDSLPTHVAEANVSGSPLSCIMDVTNGYAYLGLLPHPPNSYFKLPGIVSKVSLGAGLEAPEEVGSVTLFDGGESHLRFAVMDDVNGYAYFGTSFPYTPGGVLTQIIKMKLNPEGDAPTHVATLDLPGEEFEVLNCGVIDPVHGYAYFGTETFPSHVVKVALGSGDAPPTYVGHLTLNLGSIKSGVIDIANGYAYFGMYGRVVKIALGDGSTSPTLIGALTLPGDIVESAVIDAENGYAYFGIVDDVLGFSSVVKVALGEDNALPTIAGSVALESDERNILSAVIDPTEGYAYFVTSYTPSRVVKIALGDGDAAPTRVASTPLENGEYGIEAALIDASSGYAYLGTQSASGGADENHIAQTRPGRVIKVALGAGSSAPVRIGAITLNQYEANLAAGVIDVSNGAAYFGTHTSRGRIVKVQLSQAGYVKGTKFAMPETGYVESASLYSHAAKGNVRLAIYDNDAPRNLIWESGAFANDRTNGWLTLPISSGAPSALMLGAGEYQFAWQVDSGADVPSYAQGVAGDGLFIAQPFGASPPQLDPLSPTITDERWSSYITYDVNPPANDAAFASDTIPAEIAVGQALPVSISFLNSGDTTWTSGTGFALGVITDSCSLAPANRVPISSPASVAPGAVGRFEVMLNAMGAPGSCDIEFRMVEEFVEFFGATHSLSIPIVAGTNDAQFMNNTLPPSIAPSTGQYISFIVRNLGNKAWFTGSNHALKVISDACGLFGEGSYAAEGDGVTLMNQNRTFMTFIQTPASDGACAFQLQMTETGVGDFGPVFDGMLNVATPPNAVRGWASYE